MTTSIRRETQEESNMNRMATNLDCKVCILGIQK